MPTTPPRRYPQFRHHKASGQGFVQIDGRHIYLGRFELPETQERYHKLIAEWIATGHLPGDQQRPSLTVSEMLAKFIDYGQTYYRNADGSTSTELEACIVVIRPVRELYGRTPAAEFGPLALRAVRQRLIDQGLCRSNINKQIRRVKMVFKWGASEELIPGSVFHALQALPGLRRGRCEARESEPVRPVPQEAIDAIKPYVSKQVWAIIQLQLLTAARPGEIVVMRPGDVDRSSPTWVYVPEHHKTEHYGHERRIYLGPRAQIVLRPFLVRSENAYCFSAAEAEAERLSLAHQNRKTPLQYGNRPGTNRKADPERSAGVHYDVGSYRRAISRACEQAFPAPDQLRRGQMKGERGDRLETDQEWMARLGPKPWAELRKWRHRHQWHPHQLRHNAATNIRKEFGLETARIILGHRSAAVTTIYAEMDQQKAVEVMAQVG